MTNLTLRAPLYAQIELTYECNASCSHCYNEPRFDNSDSKPKLKILKREDVEKSSYKEMAKRLAEWGIFSVTPTGGEILTVRDRLYPVLEELCSANIDVSLNSNLIALTEEDVARFNEYGVTSVLTSIASNNPEQNDAIMGRKGALERIVSGVKLLKDKSKIYLGATMVVSQDNIGQIYETGKLAHELGIDVFSLSFVVPAKSAGRLHLDKIPRLEQIVPALQTLVQVEKDFGIHVRTNVPVPYCRIFEYPELRNLLMSCGAGKFRIQVSPSGEVRPCPSTTQVYGNVMNDKLEDIWTKLSDWQNDAYTPQSCKPCQFLNECGGGCRAEAERINGALDSEHPYATVPITFGKTQKFKPNYLSEGKTLTTAKSLKWRKEGEIFIVYAPGQRYMFCSEIELNILAAMSKDVSLKITKDIIGNDLYTSFFNKAIGLHIMEAN